MQAKCLVTLNPFPVPESVTLAPTVRPLKAPAPPSFAPTAPSWTKAPEAPAPAPFWQIPLADLDADTLHRLCEEFRDAVFFKADKPQPPEAAPPVVDTAPALAALYELRASLCDVNGSVCEALDEEDREAITISLERLSAFIARL